MHVCSLTSKLNVHGWLPYLPLPKFPVAVFFRGYIDVALFLCRNFSVAHFSDAHFFLLPNFSLPFYRCSFHRLPMRDMSQQLTSSRVKTPLITIMHKEGHKGMPCHSSKKI